MISDGHPYPFHHEVPPPPRGNQKQTYFFVWPESNENEINFMNSN